MVFQYILGGAIAITTLLLGYVLQQHSRKGKSCRGSMEIQKHGFVSGDGSGNGAADVVIVGAGVVGSSLAYALGKVTVLSFYSFLWV